MSLASILLSKNVTEQRAQLKSISVLPLGWLEGVCSSQFHVWKVCMIYFKTFPPHLSESGLHGGAVYAVNWQISRSFFLPYFEREACHSYRHCGQLQNQAHSVSTAGVVDPPFMYLPYNCTMVGPSWVCRSIPIMHFWGFLPKRTVCRCYSSLVICKMSDVFCWARAKILLKPLVDVVLPPPCGAQNRQGFSIVL